MKEFCAIIIGKEMFDHNCFQDQFVKVALLVVFAFCRETFVDATKPETLGNKTGQAYSRNDVSSREDILAMVASMKMSVDGGVSRYNPNHNNVDVNGEKPLQFDWHLNLDHIERYQLDWRVNYAENEIMFALMINQTLSKFHKGSDIFALGFSQKGELSSSDYCLIWYDLAHQIHLQDAITDSDEKLKLVDKSVSQCELVKFPSNNAPTKKQSPPVNQLEANPSDRFDGSLNDDDDGSDPIRVVLKRPLDVCLPDKDSPYYTIDNGTTHLVWFAIRGPLLSIDGLDLSRLKPPNGNERHQHGAPISKTTTTKMALIAPFNESSLANFEFGMKRVQLIASKEALATKRQPSKSAQVARSGLSHQVRMDNFEIPAKETTYWCKLFKLPHKFELRRYHITRYEAVVDNEQVVHHMELFNCANLNSEQELKLKALHESSFGWSGDCNGQDRPIETRPCKRVVLAWAMGAHPLEYPEQVGQSIGGHNYSPYFVLEVHYNNIEAQAGLLDSSGLKFHYTSRLRPFDAGVLEVGLEYTDKNSIPPNMVAPLAGHCVSECTRAAMSSALASRQSELDLMESKRQRLARQQQQQQRRRRRRRRLPRSAGDEPNQEKEEQEEVEEDEDLTMTDGGERLETPSRLELDGKITSFKDTKHQANTEETMIKQSETQLGGGGIYIFAAQMHTHLTGVASWTEQVRGGKLLRELQRDNHYSPHFQEIRLLPEPVHVAPGDALIHYCLYDTRQRSNITLGGFATTDEMCVTYLHYYPRIDLEVCKSSVDSAALEQYFAYLAEQEAQPTSKQLLETAELQVSKQQEAHLNSSSSSSSGNNNNLLFSNAGRKSVTENYLSIEWSRKRSAELLEFYSNAPLAVQCNSSNGDRLPGFWNGIPATKLQTEETDELRAAKKGLLPYSSPYQSLQPVAEYRGRGWQYRHAACRRQMGRGGSG